MNIGRRMSPHAPRGIFPSILESLVGFRGGPSGVFVDFRLLPDLIMRSEQTRTREGTIKSCTTHLESAGFETPHIDPE